MADSDKLRDRATRLFALALKAREQGFRSADDLAALASEALAQAEDMERRASVPPAPEAPQQVAQQQQQPQPKKEKK
jgi:hypothetical protein